MKTFVICLSSLVFCVIQQSDAQDSQITRESIELLITQLGAAEFAEREAATLSLTEIGVAALESLEAGAKHPDLEIRTRAQMIYGEVYQAWFEDQSQRFIQGDETVTAFPTWPGVKALTEDSQAMRRLFVSISRRHPDLVASLDKPIAFQVAAAESLADLSLQRQFAMYDPTLEDVAAMLIVASQTPTNFSDSFNMRLKNLMLHHAFGDAMKSSLANPLKKLAHSWVLGSPIAIRSEVLTLTLQQRWDVGATLARNTLAGKPAENLANLEALQSAVIVLLEFGGGGADNIAILLPLLDDQREMFRSASPLDNPFGPNPFGDKPLDDVPATNADAVTEVRDLIMAALFRLCDVRMQEAGFPLAKPHSRMFDLEAMAFPEAKPEIRAQVRAKLDQLLKSRIQP